MKVIKQEYDEQIVVADLAEHPDNPRRGDTKAVAESVNANGFYGAILVQKSTGRVLAGHTRLRVAIAQGSPTVPGFWLDVDDTQARKILLADNRTSDLAYYDDDTLFRALASVLEDDDTLLGTGYDDATYELLLGRNQETGDDLYVGNVRQGPTPGERAPIYEATDIRSIILPYGAEVYDEVIGNLQTLRARLDLHTNADVIRVVLEDAAKR